MQMQFIFIIKMNTSFESAIILNKSKQKLTIACVKRQSSFIAGIALALISKMCVDFI